VGNHASVYLGNLWKDDEHEANIRGGGKTVHVVFKYLSRSYLYRKGGGRVE
jgi:hypothetical protein